MKIIQKATILSLILFFFFSVSTYAQHEEGRHGKHHNHEQRLEKMTEELGLSDTQVEQIKALHAKKKEKSKAERKSRRKEFRAEVDKILTPEQRAKAKALRAEHKDPNKQAERRIEKWKSELSLTDEQATKVKTALVAKMTKIHALKEAAGDDKIDKTEHKAVKTAFETELKSILSNEQFASYERIKAEKKAKHKEKRGKGNRKQKVIVNNPSMEH